MPPCDSVRLNSVQLDVAMTDANRQHLIKALEELGYSVTVRADGSLQTSAFTINKDGKLSGYYVNEETALQIKRAYVSRVVKVAASKYGAKVKQTSATQLRITL